MIVSHPANDSVEKMTLQMLSKIVLLIHASTHTLIHSFTLSSTHLQKRWYNEDFFMHKPTSMVNDVCGYVGETNTNEQTNKQANVQTIKRSNEQTNTLLSTTRSNWLLTRPRSLLGSR